MNNLENTCISCLSKDRSLVPLSKLNNIIGELHLWELKQPHGDLCWECSTVIVKFYKFKIKCKQVRMLLRDNLQTYNLRSLSTLVSTTKNSYDNILIHSFDPLTDENVELKTESKPVKEETKDIAEEKANLCEDTETDQECIEIEHNSDSDYKDNIDIYVENIKSNNYKEKLKNIKQKIDKKTEKEFKEKFEEIVFSEVEMIRSREEKRNQPNFKKIPYKCDTCVLGFMRKQTYDLHVEKKHHKSIGSHLCPVCEVRFPNEKAVERHKRRHYVCYRCRLCRYDTGELWSAVNHCRVKHRDDTTDKIHCAQCRTIVKNPQDLAEHMRTEHTLYCNECGEKFKGKHTLRTHKIRIHAVKREFLCDLCKKTFMTKTRLESHMVTHNASIAKRLAYCAICNIQYKNIYVYRNHLKNSANHSERAYPCPDCNKKFASKVYWTKHYNFYHLHKSQYHCEICNKVFISDWRLKNHRQKHHGLSRSRDHSCNVCGKKFYTLSTLRGHQLTHSEQRSYMCEDCGDTFKQRPALYTHSRLVHKGGKKHK